MGQRRPPRIVMVVGSSVHSGAEANFKQKIESHEDLREADVVGEAIAAYELNSPEAELDYEDRDRNRKAVIGEKKDKTARVMCAHCQKLAPGIQPIMVEARQEITLPKIGKTFLGFIDLVDDAENIRDLKITSRAKSQNDADTSLQLSSYWLTYQALTGNAPASVGLDCLVDGKRGVKLKSVNSQRTKQNLQRLVNTIMAVDTAIQAGNFPPCAPDNWICSPRFCGYWDTCKYGGKP